METGADGKGKHDGVYGGQVVAGVIGDAGGEHDHSDRDDLDGRVDLAQPGGPEPSEAGHDVNGGGPYNDKYIPADNRNGYPERYRQVAGNGLGKNTAHRQDDEGGNHHQLVGYGIEDRAQLRFLLKASSQQSIKSVCQTRNDEHCQGQYESLVEEKCDENRNQHHPKDGEHVWDGNNSGGGHRLVNSES